MLPRFNFDRSMFQPTTTLYLPLDENHARMTDCYTNTDYYIYFYQTARMSRPKAVYIIRSVEQGVAGMFQESLKEVLDYSETVDTSKWIHDSTVDISVSSSRSRLNIALAVRKTPGHYTIFRNYNSLLQIYICKELASTLNMANSSVWIYFPQWYEPSVQQKLTFQDKERLDRDQKFNGLACVPATKIDVFSAVEGKLDSNFPRVGLTEANGDYTRNHYMACFKLRGKLYDKENYKIHVEVPLKFEFDEQNMVQYLHIHCDELLYDPVLRSVNRPNGAGGAKIASADMRQLHYKRMIGSLQRLQEFQIEIKDNHGELVKFEDGNKTIMTLNFKPTGSKELSHFTQSVRCQLPHILPDPIPLKTTDRWQVALMDMTFPKRWINVKQNEMVFYVGIEGNPQPTRYVLPRGTYTNESLVAKMNEMASTQGELRFYIYPNSKLFKVDLVQKTPSLSVKITSPLCKVLGWETEKEFNTTEGWVKPDDTDQWKTSGNIVSGTTSGTTYSFGNKKQIKINVNRGYNIMYVYAPDLIQSVHVGHTMSELLNYAVPGLAEVRGDSYFVQFNSLSYVKVKQQLHSLKSILVEIRNEVGELFEFHSDLGQTPTVSLNFVKVQ